MVKQNFDENYRKEIEGYIDNKRLLDKLLELNLKKQEVINLKSKYGCIPQKIVITINGTPRAGKTTCVDNLSEFFKKANLRTANLIEPAGLVYQTLKSKEEKVELLKDRVGFVEKQYEIGFKSIENSISSYDIILCDRGFLDTFVWYDMYYKMGLMDKDRYIEFLKKLKEQTGYQNWLYSLYVNSETSMIRDYRSSISIEPRTTMNKTNVEKYNDSLKSISALVRDDIDRFELIDTNSCGILDPSIRIANECLDEVKKLYIERRK